LFPLTFKDSKKFPQSSHLVSIRDKRAVSFSTDVETAFKFGEYVFVYEVRDLLTYFVSIDEDELDDVYIPKGSEALALPEGRYDEKEISIIGKKAKEKMSLVGVLVCPEYSRTDSRGKSAYTEIDENTLRREGAFRGYIMSSISKLHNIDMKEFVRLLFRGEDFREIFDDLTETLFIESENSNGIVEIRFNTGYSSKGFRDVRLFISEASGKTNISNHGTALFQSIPDKHDLFTIYKALKENISLNTRFMGVKVNLNDAIEQALTGNKKVDPLFKDEDKR